jgi:hypothetical protein
MVAIRRAKLSFHPRKRRPNSMSPGTWVIVPLILAATVGGISASSVVAQSSGATSPPSTSPSIQSSVNGYGNQDKLCLAWNDGCVTCRRDAAAGAACSNIGIACQPKEITCTQRQSEPAK